MLAGTLIFVCPMFGETGPEPPAQTLAVILKLEETIPPVALHEMEAEVEEILSPLGLHLQWHSARENLYGVVFERIVSVRFQGSAKAQWNHGASSTILGSTYVVDGEVLSYCRVDGAAVQHFIEPWTRRVNRARQPLLVGMALGRVLAHEIYHAITRTTKHGIRGVAKRALTAQDLLAPSLYLDRPDMEAMRAKIAGPPGLRRASDAHSSPAVTSFSRFGLAPRTSAPRP